MEKFNLESVFACQEENEIISSSLYVTFEAFPRKWRCYLIIRSALYSELSLFAGGNKSDLNSALSAKLRSSLFRIK